MANTKLDRLNELLRANMKTLDFPAFRQQVTNSGGNQDWILKAMKRHPEAPAEIVELLKLPFKQLLVPYEEPDADLIRKAEALGIPQDLVTGDVKG